MWLAENYDPVAPLQHRDNIENFIKQSLLGDWIIRIEYSAANHQAQADWIQWGPALFAISSAHEVMHAIDACHASFPQKEVRLYAEKVRPQTRLIYSVYNPAQPGLEENVSADVVPQAASRNWPRSVDESIPVRADTALSFG